MPNETQAQTTEGNTVREFASLDDFVGALNTDKEFRKAYQANPSAYDKYNAMYGEKITGQSAPPQEDVTPQGNSTVPPVEPKSTDSDDEEVTATVKLKKSQLGTFLKNRTPDEAVLEIVKGKQEADKYIDKLRAQVTEKQNTEVSLRSELAQLRSATPVAPAQAPAQVPGQPDTLSSDDLADVDLFDPDSHKKLFTVVKQVEERAKRAESLVESFRNAQEEKKIKENQEALQKAALEREFSEIESLQHEVPDLATGRPIAEIDREVGQFYQSLGQLANKANHMEAVQLYFSNTPEGEAFRKQAEANRLAPPDGYDKHQQIVAIKALRKQDRDAYLRQLSTVTGKELQDHEVPWSPNSSYTDYWLKVRGTRPAQQEVAPSAPAPFNTAEATAKVVEQQSHYAKEVPPGQVIPQISAATMTQDQQMSLINKVITAPSMVTSDEARLAVELYKVNQIPCPPSILKKAGLLQ